MGILKDINSQVRAVQTIAPAEITGTTNGAGVALKGAGAGMVTVNTGVVSALDGSNKLVLTVLTGPDATIGNATAIDADAYHTPRDSDGNVWDRVLNATTQASKAFQVGFENKRGDAYAFAVWTATGSPSVIAGAQIILGALPQSPNQA